MFTTIIIFLLILSLLVFVHEFGHFFTARKFGVKADEFGIGFPPRAIGFYKDSQHRWRKLIGNKELDSLEGDKKPVDTVYSLNWLPLGGFVKIKGQDGESPQDQDSFGSKKIWKRAVILVAGVFMNVVLAFILFSACYIIGAPQSVTSGGKIQITEVSKNSPAAGAGVLSGDVISSVDGISFENVPDLQEYIALKGGQEISLELIRQDKILSLLVTPEVRDDRALIGIGLDQIDFVSYPFFQAIWEGLKHTAILFWFIIIAFFKLIYNLVIGAGVGDAVGGPIRIAQMTGEVARFGLVNLFNFTALLSLNLAVINLLPLPALDGGRILFLIIEKIKGKPVKRETEALVHNIGFMLLMALIVLITYKDIARMF